MSNRKRKRQRRSALQGFFDFLASATAIDEKRKLKLMRRLARLSPNLVLASSYGPLMRPRLADATNRAALFGEYDPTVYETVMSLRPGDAFIDVGANVGIFSLVAAEKVGPDGLVIAFEPQRHLANELRANLALNGLENVYVFDFAIGDATSASNICEVDKGRSGMTYVRKGAGPPAWLVDPTRDLTVVEPMIGQRDVMIKVDTEGAELSALKGLRGIFDRVRSVVVEINPDYMQRFAATPRELFAYLERRNFTPTRMTLDEVEATPSLHYDEVFVNRVGTS